MVGRRSTELHDAERDEPLHQRIARVDDLVEQPNCLVDVCPVQVPRDERGHAARELVVRLGQLRHRLDHLGRRRLPSVVVIGFACTELAWRGVDEHQRADEIGMAQGQLLGDEASVRVAEDDDLVDAERARHRGRVIGELLDRDRLDRRASGPSVAPVVDEDQVETLGQRLQGAAVEGVVDAEAPVEDEARLTHAIALVPDRGAVHCELGHDASLRSIAPRSSRP